MATVSQRGRAALFGLACAALCAAALAFSPGGSRPQAGRGEAVRSLGPGPPSGPAFALRAAARVQRLAAALKRTARRFLTAFLRYEVGAGGPGVAAALRDSATSGFARQLLRAPPRPPAAAMPPARLGALQLAFVSAAASRALISASASRGGRPEQLSFLFVRHRGRWLASGPGQ